MKNILDAAIDRAGIGGEVRGPVGPAMLRGGRMTKHKGVAASYSPDLGLAVTIEPRTGEGRSALLRAATSALRWGSAPIALLASGLAIATPAAAQDACAVTGPDEVTCEDNGPPATTTQVIAGTNLDILIDDGFAIDTTGVGGDGLQVTTNGGLTLNQVSGSSSIVGDNGFTFTNNAGLVRVRTGGPITGTTGVGISGTHSGDRFDLITVDGDVVGQTRGISVFTSSTSQTEVVTGNVTGLTRYGLIAFENSAGSLRIDTSAGTVFGGTIGVYGRNGGAGNLVIETPPT